MSTEHVSDATAILLGEPKQAEEPETDAPEPEQDTGEDLLAQEEAPESASQAADGPVEMPETYTVKDLAEKLGVRPQDVYASLQIDVGGESLSIGEYKDRAKDLKRADEFLATAEDAKAEFEREFLVKSQALAQREAGKPLTEQEIERYKAQREQIVQAEAAKLVKVRPELADTDNALKASKRVTDELGKYGIQPWEAEQVTDARLTLAFLRLADLEERLARAKDSEVRKKRPQRPKGETREAVANRGQKAVRDFKDGKVSQQDAIRTLLTG